MKRHLRYMVLAVAAICLLGSCNKNEGNKEKSFTASIERGGTSKTHLVGDNVKWSPYDLILVSNAAGNSLAFELTSGANTENGIFYSSEDFDFTSPFRAVYPAFNPDSEDNTISGSTATVHLPAVQRADTTETFGEGYNPMVAYSTNQTLAFKNLCGGLCIPFKGKDNAGTFHVTRIVLTSNDSNEILWGEGTANIDYDESDPNQPTLVMSENTANNKHQLTLTCDETLNSGDVKRFYFMLPPHTLKTGFSFKVYGDNNTVIYENMVTWSSSPDFLKRNYLMEVNSTLPVGLPPTVNTLTPENVQSTSATLKGEVTADGGSPVTSRGLCWGTAANPDVTGSHSTNGDGLGSFSNNVTSLVPGTTYHVRAYAINSCGIAYGEDKTFTAPAVAPTVKTNDATSVTSTTATLNGEVTNTGGANITARGFCYSLNHIPATGGGTSVTSSSTTNTFNKAVTGLTRNKTYYVRAWATNSAGTTYGEEKTFTTPAEDPTVVTDDATNIQTSAANHNASAKINGRVTDDGGTTTSRGFYWSASSIPATGGGTSVAAGSGSGAFNYTLTNLELGKTYYVRAWANNSAKGLVVANQKTFVIPALAPSVTTNAASSVASTSATLNGNVTHANGANVTTRGFCWSTSANPTTTSHPNGGTATSGSGTGSFNKAVTGLAPGTTYHVRAYATNSVGTTYGADVTFTTPAVLPTVHTTAATALQQRSATLNGSVTSTGGAAVTARGFVWSTSANPTLSSHPGGGASGSLGTGTASSMNYRANRCLTKGTLYHVRAYATNSVGTAYGEDITFRTYLPYFSVSSSTVVYVSPGNLQYQASSNTWRFPTNQYDYLGAESNMQISPSTSSWIDLFGWACSGGYNNDRAPWQTSYDDGAYCIGAGGAASLTGTQYDWGVRNPIYHQKTGTTDPAGTWRTPLANEMYYLFFNRAASTVGGTANARFVKAIVNGVKCLILLPDYYEQPTDVSISNINNQADFPNSYNTTQWGKMEQEGAMLLPCSDYRQCSAAAPTPSIGTLHNYCLFWCADYGGPFLGGFAALGFEFYPNAVNAGGSYSMHNGMAVRLIKNTTKITQP